MSEGWIKSYRKFVEWEWFKTPGMFRLFHYLLYKANHETGYWKGQRVERGQLITGRFTIANGTGLSEQSIRTCLKRLKSTNEITIESTNRYSLITIVNYDSYQSEEGDSNQEKFPESNQQSTSNQPATNHKQEYIESNITIGRGECEGGNHQPARRGPTKFDIKTSITQEQYQKMLQDPELAAGNKQWLYRQAKSMGDHFCDKRKKDWAATLRNWCRKARYQFNDSPNKNSKYSKPTTADLNRGLIDELTNG